MPFDDTTQRQVPETVARRAARLIDGAIAALLERGWCRKEHTNGKGELCLIGALNYAEYHDARQDGLYSPERLTAIRAIASVIGDRDVPAWNDSRRKRETVIRALRSARETLNAL